MVLHVATLVAITDSIQLLYEAAPVQFTIDILATIVKFLHDILRIFF